MEQYPKSSTAYDSYADELEEDHQTKAAMANYRKALLLNPANAHAKTALERLANSRNE